MKRKNLLMHHIKEVDMSSFISLFSYDFMVNALIAVLIIGPLFALLGTMIVMKKMAFFSDALGHSAFTGVAVGVILGIVNTEISMIGFAVIFAILLNHIKKRNMENVDTIISVFASVATALGLCVLSFGGNFSEYSSLLVGDILSISKMEILYLIIIFVVTIVFMCLAINKLNAISINQTVARSHRIKVQLIEDIFAVIIAITVMLSIRWVGLLLVNALLILPAASSRNISENMREYVIYSVVFSLFSGLLGLFISYFINIATGPVIVIVAAIIYFATYLYSKG